MKEFYSINEILVAVDELRNKVNNKVSFKKEKINKSKDVKET